MHRLHYLWWMTANIELLARMLQYVIIIHTMAASNSWNETGVKNCIHFWQLCSSLPPPESPRSLSHPRGAWGSTYITRNESWKSSSRFSTQGSDAYFTWSANLGYAVGTAMAHPARPIPSLALLLNFRCNGTTLPTVPYPRLTVSWHSQTSLLHSCRPEPKPQTPCVLLFKQHPG